MNAIEYLWEVEQNRYKPPHEDTGLLFLLALIVIIAITINL